MAHSVATGAGNPWGGITEQERSILVREGFRPCDLVGLTVGELGELLGLAPSAPLLALQAREVAGHSRLLDAPYKGGLKRLMPQQQPTAVHPTRVPVRVLSESRPSPSIPFSAPRAPPGADEDEMRMKMAQECAQAMMPYTSDSMHDAEPRARAVTVLGGASP